MSKPKKPKDFLKLPQYEGGKEALRKFIDKNLQYPEEALKNNVEGTVEAEYFINGLGDVKKVNILEGIGFGCDEEVIRLLKSLVYQKAINRGIKTTTRKSIKIHFKLPKKEKTIVKYNLVSKDKKVTNQPTTRKNTYTIKINYTS